MSQTQLAKLRQIMEMRDPTARMQSLLMERAVLDALLRMEVAKGDKGDTPVKGVDYFTDREIEQIVAEVVRRIDKIRAIKPVKGVDYFTKAEIDAFAGQIARKVKRAATPVYGVDYLTESHRQDIVNDVMAQVRPHLKPPKVPTVDEVAGKLREKPVKYGEIEGAPDLSDLQKLVEFLKRGGFRGGGSSTSGASFNPQTPAGLVNNVNVTFTVTGTINAFFVNGQLQVPGVDYTLVGTTITTTKAPPTNSVLYAF